MNSGYLFSTSGPLAWKFYGTALGFWIAFIVVALTLFAVLLWLRRTIAARLGVLAALTGAHVQQLISGLVCRTHALFLSAASLYAVSHSSTWGRAPRTTRTSLSRSSRCARAGSG
jgi:hypothetical protein